MRKYIIQCNLDDDDSVRSGCQVSVVIIYTRQIC